MALQRLFGRELPVRMRAAVEQPRKHAAGDRAGLRPWPASARRAAAPRSRSSASAGNVGLRSMSARRSSVGANLAVVDWKPIDPLSPPMPTRDVRAEQLQRVRQRLAVARLRALAHHRRRQLGEAAAVRRLELVGAAQERDRERDERQIVLLRHDQLGAVGERRLSSTPARAAPAACRPAASSCDRAPAAARRRGGQQRQRAWRASARSTARSGVTRRSRPTFLL